MAVSLSKARREGSGVWSTPAVSEADAGILEATILTEADRDALLIAASAPTMRPGGGR